MAQLKWPALPAGGEAARASLRVSLDDEPGGNTTIGFDIVRLRMQGAREGLSADLVA